MRPGTASRAAWAAAAGALCVCAPLAMAAHDEHASETISECVSYSQSAYDSGVRLRLESACERELTCSLRWTLRCEGGRTRSEGAAFELTPGASESIRASAAACRDEGWNISDITWRCRTR